MLTCNTPITSALDVNKATGLGIGIGIAIIAPLSFITNTLLLVSLKATKQSSCNATNKLITYLCVSDSLNGAINMPIFTYLLLRRPSECHLQEAATIISTTFSITSGFIVVLIAIERYLYMSPYAGSKTIWLRKLFQPPLVHYIVVGSFVFAFLQSVGMVYIFRTGKTGTAIANILLAVVCTVGISIITIAYIKGYRKLRRITEETSATLDDRRKEHGRHAYMKDLQRTVLVLITTMYICYAPFGLSCLAQGLNQIFTLKSDPRLMNVILAVSIMAVYSNCLINSILIFNHNKKAKQWVLHKLTKFKSTFSETKVTTYGN